jgi:predicted  nucleic acid-binding Zn-ribbon protein
MTELEEFVAREEFLIDRQDQLEKQLVALTKTIHKKEQILRSVVFREDDYIPEMDMQEEIKYLEREVSNKKYHIQMVKEQLHVARTDYKNKVAALKEQYSDNSEPITRWLSK